MLEQKGWAPLLLSLLYLFFAGLLSGQERYPEQCLTKHASHDRYASYSPDGSQIIFESDRNGNWDIFIMKADGSDQRALTRSADDDRRPSWHPNEKTILFESNRNGENELFTIDTNGEGLKKILSSDNWKGEVAFARYSPGGAQIAFTVQEGEQQFNLYLYDVDKKEIRALTDGPFRHVYPYWRPNGKELLFFSRHETNNEDDEVYRLRLKSGKLKRLTHWPKHNFCPAWSPDGRRIAYVTSMEDIRSEIYIMNCNGKKQKRITFNEDGDTLPNWHPDGQRLLITGYRGDNFEICEIRLE